MPKKKITKCPKCGCDRIYLDPLPRYETEQTFDQWRHVKRIVLLCGNNECDQKFTQNLKSGEIEVKE